MLSLTVGPFPALERHLAQRLAAGKPARAGLPLPVAVVAPSRTLIRHLEQALTQRHGLALANVRFHTYQSLARAIVLKAGTPADKLAEDPLLEEFLLRHVIGAGEVRPELGELAKTPGLPGALLNTIRDLEEAQVDPCNIPPESLEEEEGEVRQLKEILPLLDRLKTTIAERGLLSRAGVVAQAAGQASHREIIGSLSSLIYYGAYDLTQHQLDFLFALAEAAPVEVMFPAFPTREGRLHPAYRFAETTLAMIGQKAGDTLWLKPDGEGPLCRHLSGLLGDDPREFAGPGLPPGVSVWRARDTRAQWDLIAGECWRLIGKEGVAPHEIAVVARSLGAALPVASASFRAAWLPWTARAPVPLEQLEAGRALMALVRTLGGDFSPEPVLDAAGSPLLNICSGRLGMPEARAESRRLWAGAGAEDWEILKGRGGAAAQLLEAVRRSAAQADKFPSKGDFCQYSRCLLEICEESVLPGGEPGDAVPILDAFFAALKRLRALGASLGPIEREDFFMTALGALKRAGVALFAERGGVELLDAMDARGVSARCVFLADLAEGTFPRLVREDPFLRDPARQVLNESLGYKIQLKGRAGLEEERLLFHSLLGAAREKLYLIWPAGDGGKTALPSGFLGELMAGFGASLPESALPAEDPPPVVAEAAWAQYQARRAWLEEIENPGASPGPRDGTGFAPLAAGGGIRVTGLVELARCPFRGYVPGALGIREPRGPRNAFEPEASQIGLAVHAALNGAVGELRGDWQGADEEELAQAARRHFARALDEIIPEAARFPPIRATLLQDWARLIEELLKADREWCAAHGVVPRREEQELSGRLGEGAFWMELRGRADRIDEGGDGVHLVDYKSHLKREKIPRKPGFSPDFYQLALYQEMLGVKPGAGSMSVYHLGRGLGGAQLVSAEGQEAEAISERASRLNAVLLAMLEAGRLPPFPKERKRPGVWRANCDLCGLSLICRREHEPTRERLATGGAWADLEQALDGREGQEEEEMEEDDERDAG